MSDLETRLNSPAFSTQLEAVKTLLDSAQARTTCWGVRIVEVKGVAGYVTLDALARKILSIPFKEIDNLTSEQRIAGIEIARKLKPFYEASDKCNFLSGLLRFIREFRFHPYTTRFYVDDDYSPARPFLEYSEASFVQRFGGTVDTIRKNPAHFSTNGLPPHVRIEAREDHLRAKTTVDWDWNPETVKTAKPYLFKFVDMNGKTIFVY